MTGTFESVTFLPGYPRELTFVGDYAVIGVSKPRHEKTFIGLPLDEELSRRNATAQCGHFVVDLSGVNRPKALGFQTDEIRHNGWFTNQRLVQQWRGVDK
jgi:Domain of unknown function (DUF4915)